MIFCDFDVYMCISAGANARELLNLQGKWNMDPKPAWNCDHHYEPGEITMRSPEYIL